jgi:hypothetical protein
MMRSARRRTRRTVRLALAVVATVALAGVAWPRDGGNPFRAYARVALTPGVGIGDLQIGATTLGTFLDRFGAGRPALVFGDETAVELSFPRAGATFTFVVEGACADVVVRSRRDVLRALGSRRAFAGAYPACAAEPLDVLAVAWTVGRAHFTGATSAGVHLGQRRDDALAALGAPLPTPSEADVASGPEGWFDPSGLGVRFAPDPAERAEDVWQVVELTFFAP